MDKAMMKSMIAVMCLAFISVKAQAFEVNKSERIINGELVNNISTLSIKDSTVGFMKKKEHYYDAFCTGSLIASNVILSSAHCFDKNKKENIYVVFGPMLNTNLELNPAKNIYRVKEIFQHEKYIGGVNDIALVLLDRNVDSSFKPITLISNKDIQIERYPLQISGHSTYTKKNNDNILDAFGIERNRNYVEYFMHDEFNNLVIPLYSKEVYYNKNLSFDDIIMMNQFDGGVCPGDSGGPTSLLIDKKFYLIGVNTSISRKFLSNYENFDCESTSQTTKVASFIPWIKKTIKNIKLKEKKLSALELKNLIPSAKKNQCLSRIESIYTHYEDEITFNYFLGYEGKKDCSKLQKDREFLTTATVLCFSECEEDPYYQSYCDYIERGNRDLYKGIEELCVVR